jgi:hypothetical protein
MLHKKGANMKKNLIRYSAIFATVSLLVILSQSAFAAPPVVKTVPWVATNPLIPHDSWSGKSIRLKGTSDVQGATIQYMWDFGDGSPVATGTVSNMFAIEASHVYTVIADQIFTARLTVTNTSSGEFGSKEYYVKVRATKTLAIEVNVAIDEGLWYLHKDMRRSGSNVGADEGDWIADGNLDLASSSYLFTTAVNLNAFFVNGHLETGVATNPYTETVQRGMRRLFEGLQSYGPLSTQTYAAPMGGTYNPDANGNTIGIQVAGINGFSGSYPPYQGGMIMDAIIASGTPDAVTTTGGANIIGRKYKDIIQDMVDMYAWGQTDSGYYGGWRYSWNYGQSDNSTNQWAAVGLIAAKHSGWATVPDFVITANLHSVSLTQAANGSFGYTDSTAFYSGSGPYASTPSGMVQMVLDGKGRGYSQWDLAETYLKNNFCNTGNYYSSIRSYYYGLFSFTKAMLLHDGNGDGIPEPISLLGNTIDWYSADGTPCNGVARTLISTQNSLGHWYDTTSYASEHRYFQTAWAIIMLNKTVFESGLPVAVAKATPNPAVANQVITLDGSTSYHQDNSKQIISWQWDFNNDGTFDASEPFAAHQFPSLGSYPVKLKVGDNSSPQKFAETIVTVVVNTPPLAPTAKAGGPYNFCIGRNLFLNGTGSINPDEGGHQPGSYPGDTIQSYLWDLDGDAQFDDATSSQPNVTGFFTAPGSYLIQLKVTDTTASSYPASGYGDLSDTDSATVVVRASTAPECACIANLAARPKLNKVQLTWTNMAGVHHYNVYRGTVAGGPYLKIGSTTSNYSTYLDSNNVVVGNTYYYIVRPANNLEQESCQSNQAAAAVTGR